MQKLTQSMTSSCSIINLSVNLDNSNSEGLNHFLARLSPQLLRLDIFGSGIIDTINLSRCRSLLELCIDCNPEINPVDVGLRAQVARRLLKLRINMSDAYDYSHLSEIQLPCQSLKSIYITIYDSQGGLYCTDEIGICYALLGAQLLHAERTSQ